MASNLGIDFGSTFTMLSSYDDAKDTVTGIQTERGNVYVPSEACVIGGSLQFGSQVQMTMNRQPTIPYFRAFKMLLHEQNVQTLSDHGYSGKYTPKRITSEFLMKQITVAARNRNVKQFDHAVICVPEHWTESYSRNSGRAILLDICKKMKNGDVPFLKSIRVVTEPVAASAYYAHNYYKHHNNTPFEGNIIVIDYGGGTLDITLTEVTAKPGTKATNAMEINALWRTGAGENHPDRIGDAGLAFMEKVTALALESVGLPNTKVDGDFVSVKSDLEAALMNNTDELSNYIDAMYGNSLDLMADDNGIFATSYGSGNEVPFTYAMLYNTFEKYIKPVLTENLKELKQYLDVRRLDPLRDMARIKLAVVGGFGQFPLVQKTVWDFFGYAGNDMDITNGAEGGKQDAISFGAALIAGNAVAVKVTSKYSIGLRITRGGRETYEYAIRCGEPIDDFNKVHPLGGRWFAIGYDGSSDPKKMPWVFAINKSKTNKKLKSKYKGEFAYRMTPCEEQCRLLLNMVPKGLYHFGFSMDESEIYTLHIYRNDIETDEPIKPALVTQPLGNFNDIFGANVIFDDEDEKHLIFK